MEDALLRISDSVELHLVGDWPELESAHHRIVHHGVVLESSRMMEIMDSCNVLLLPSLSEGMPTVVLEAKARGLDIIATDVGAMSELEEHLLQTNDPEQLARSIRKAEMKTPSGLSRDYSWKNIAASTLSVLDVNGEK